MYQSLYRKYRPDSFEKVIGQDHITKTLVNQIKSGNIAHAYLLTGTRGTGKTSVARIFARAINCLSPIDGSPCGECDCCKKILSGVSLDIVEIDAASNNSVDDARAIRDNVRYAPVDCKYKVYIIDEVHQLSGAAFNALLKTLEEPPAHAVFILATTEVQKIPATIMSRCLRLDFHLVPQEVLERHVASIFDKEGVKYTSEGIAAIAAAGEGSVRDTLSVADMCVSYSDVVDYENVLGVLGANDPTMIAKIAFAALSKDVKEAIGLIESASSLGKSVQLLTKDLTKYFRDLIIIKHDRNANSTLKLPDKLFAAAEEIARSFDGITLMRALDIFSNVEAKSRYSNQPKILLETAIIKTAMLSGEELSDLIAKIDSLEKKVAELELAPRAKPSYDSIKQMLSSEKKPSAPVAPTAPSQLPEATASVAPTELPFDPDQAESLSSLPFDAETPTASPSLPEAPAVTIESGMDPIAALPEAVKKEMMKLRGRILLQLKDGPFKLLYLGLTNENNSLLFIRNGKLIVAYRYKSDYSLNNTPTNLLALKTIVSQEIDSPIEVEMTHFDENAPDAMTTSDIVKLFAGAESINIRRK